MSNVNITFGLPDDKLDEIANFDLDLLSAYLTTLSQNVAETADHELRQILTNRYLYLVSVYGVRSESHA